jgi:type I restriction enzyme, S subunit
MSIFPIAKLFDCVDLLAGFAFKSEGFTNSVEDIPLVKGENVSQGRILWEISKRWPVADLVTLEKYKLRHGDVVVAMDRPWVPAGLKWAYIRKNDPRSLLVQRCSRLRSKTEKLDQEYLRFIIGSPSFESYVIPITTGVNVPHISGRQILEYEFPLPPLHIQRRVAGILSAYDELIENSQRRIKILEGMARALYREWFVHFRFPGHESTPRIPSPLGEIPQGWTATTLGQLVEIKKGKNITKNTAHEGSVPVVAGGLGPAYFHDTANTRAPVITISASGANAGFVNLYYTAVWASDCSYIDFSATPHVFYYYLWLDDRRSRITHLQRGSAQPHVYSRDLAQLEGVQPPNELLDAFLRNISPLFGVIRRLSAKIDNLNRTRDLLLKHLMSEQFQKGEFK